jgi:hypothetical protein
MSNVTHPSSSSIGASTGVKNFVFNHKIELLFAVVGLISSIAIGCFASMSAGLAAGGVCALIYGVGKAVITWRNKAVQQAKAQEAAREQAVEREQTVEDQDLPLPSRPRAAPTASSTADQLKDAKTKRQQARDKAIGRPDA